MNARPVLSSVENAMFSLACLCVVVGLAGGCATPPAYPSRSAATCAAHQTKNRVTVGAQPIFDRKELNHYFGKDLVTAGMLPVLVVVENGTTEASYLLAMKNCAFSQGAGFGGKENLSSGQAEAWLGGPLLAADALSKRTGLTLKELRDQTVSPGQAEQGFVYFRLPQTLPSRGDAVSMRIRLPRLGSNDALDFELPFTWER